MKALIRIAAFLAALAICAVTPALAASVFVLPSSQSATTVPVYAENPFAGSVPVATPAGAVAVLAKPDGSRFYVVSASATQTVEVFDASLTLLRSLNLGAAARAAALSPDGTRLLVLVGASFRVIDVSGTTEADITPLLVFDVGNNPNDVAFSLDSRRAFILSTDSKTVTVYDLASNQVVGEAIAVNGANAIAAAPNGQIYVSAVNSVYELDGYSGAVVQQIPLNGSPGKAAFTPDGKYAVLPNQPPFMVTGLAFLVDLKARSVLGILSSTGANAGLILNQLAAVDNLTVYGVSTSTERLARITLDPANAGAPIALTTTGFPLADRTDVRAVAASKHQPTAKYLFAASETEVSRGVIASGTGDNLALSLEPGALQLAGAASTAIPSASRAINDQQTVAAGATSLPLVIRIWDGDGVPVVGAAIQFSTVDAGVTIESANVVTSSDGYASTRVTAAETAAGQKTIKASIPNLGDVIFTVLVGLGGGGDGGGNGAVIGGLAMYSGNGQIALAEHAAPNPMRVLLTDASGQPISGGIVNWSVTSGGGTVAATSPTDVNGIAQMVFGAPAVFSAGAYSQSTVSAAVAGLDPVVFTMTAIRGTLSIQTRVVVPTNMNLAGQAGQTLTAGVQVSVIGFTTQQGIPNVGVAFLRVADPSATPSALCAGAGATALTNAAGIATCDVVFGPALGGPVQADLDVGGLGSYALYVTVAPGPPGQIQKITGDGQTGDRGATLPVQLRATVRDSSGHILPGTAVTWEVVAGSATLVNAATVADSQGGVIATVRLGNTPGPVQVRLRAGSAEATFSLTVRGAAGALRKISGDAQTATVSTQFAQPLVIELVDDQGAALVGAAVTFAATGVNVTLGTAAATTDATGRASTLVTAGATAGAVAVTATSFGLTQTFNLQVVPVGPVVLAANIRSAISGDPGVSAGGIIAIYGQGVAPGVNGYVVANNGFPGPLPTTLEDVQVAFGNTPAPIYQVNNVSGQEWLVVQAPFDLSPGTTSVTITVAGVSTTVTGVVVKDYQPGIFETLGTAGQRWAVLTKEDGSHVTVANPVVRGVTRRLKMYCAGLGQTVPALGTGSVGVAGQSLAAGLVVAVRTLDGGIGGGVNIVSAVAMEGVVGVYVVTFDVPPAINSGLDQTLAFAIAKADGAPDMTRLIYSTIPSVQ